MEDKKRNWEEIVKNSNGTSFFVPEVLVSSFEEYQKKDKEFQKKLNEIGKDEIELKVMFQNIMWEARKFIESAGNKDIWTKDIGVDQNALADGKFIINITDGK